MNTLFVDVQDIKNNKNQNKKGNEKSIKKNC